MNYCDFNYKTTLPKEANAPSVSIHGDIPTEYDIFFNIIKEDGIHTVKRTKCKTNETVFANFNQWYNDWQIDVYENEKLVDRNNFDVTNKVVFIKMDAYALGDNIAWISYVDEFRKLRKCKVICSTFFNDLFKNIYKEILFVAPNTNIDNVYTQYYIGATNELVYKYSPVSVDYVPLQNVISTLLNLPLVELRPPLERQFPKIECSKKYVCISEYASHEKKHWRYPDGWQIIVDFLTSIGYDVLVISKESTKLKNIIDLTGNRSIIDRGLTLKNADFFMGVSSGLSWLSWGVNTHTFLISDVTHINHEFKSNVTRISANSDLNNVDYNAPNITHPDTVIKSIKKYLEFKN